MLFHKVSFTQDLHSLIQIGDTDKKSIAGGEGSKSNCDIVTFHVIV